MTFLCVYLQTARGQISLPLLWPTCRQVRPRTVSQYQQHWLFISHFIMIYIIINYTYTTDRLFIFSLSCIFFNYSSDYKINCAALWTHLVLHVCVSLGNKRHSVKLPSTPGFPSHKSIRPFTVYALEQFRQHFKRWDSELPAVHLRSLYPLRPLSTSRWHKRLKVTHSPNKQEHTHTFCGSGKVI